MLIIIEGPPRAGKTQLAEKIASKAGDTVHRVAMRKTEVSNRSYISTYAINDTLEDYDPSENSVTVWDEYSWVPIVYRDMLGETKKNINPLVRWFVEAKLRTLGALTIYIPTTPDDVRQRLRATNPYLSPSLRIRKNINKICESYDQISSTASMMVCEYPKFKIEEILKGAAALQLHAKTLAKWPEYIGHATPKGLVVTSDTASGFGPTIPWAGTEMNYLLSGLDPVTRDSYGYVNAALMTDDKLEELVAQLGNPPIIAVGVELSYRLRSSGIKHVGIPAPNLITVNDQLVHARVQYGEMVQRGFSSTESFIDWSPSGTR